MSVYYQLKANQPEIDKRFESEIEVCDYIMRHDIGVFEVFCRDDVKIPMQARGSAIIFPMNPMNEDVTQKVIDKITAFKKLKK